MADDVDTAIIVGGAALAGVALWMLWPLLKAGRGIAGDVGDLASGAGSVVSGTGNVLDKTGDLIGATVGQNVVTTPNRTALIDESLPQLQLKIVNKQDRNSGGKKWTKISVLAHNLAGDPVPYPKMVLEPVMAITKKVLGNTVEYVGNANGMIGAEWTVADVPFTDAEDDVVIYLVAKGYNPSRVVRVK